MTFGPPDTKQRARDEQHLAWLDAKSQNMSYAAMERKFGASKGTISGTISAINKATRAAEEAA